MGAAIGGQPDQAIVRTRPDAVDVERRRRDRIDYSALLRLGRRVAAKDAHGSGYFPDLASEVRTDLLPTLSAVAGSTQSVRREVEKMLIDWREHNWLSANHAKIRSGDQLRNHVLRLCRAPVVARQLAAEHNVGVERIGHDIAVLFRRHRMPIAKRDLAIVAPAGNASRAALLLSAAQAIGKSIVGVHVIHLRRRLVVPGAPGLAAVYGNDGALIAGQDDRVGIVGIDPDVLIIVTDRKSTRLNSS